MSWSKGKSRNKTTSGHHIYGKRQVTSGLLAIIGIVVSQYCLLIGIFLILIGIIGSTYKILDGIPHLMYGRRKWV